MCSGSACTSPAAADIQRLKAHTAQLEVHDVFTLARLHVPVGCRDLPNNWHRRSRKLTGVSGLDSVPSLRCCNMAVVCAPQIDERLMLSDMLI